MKLATKVTQCEELPIYETDGVHYLQRVTRLRSVQRFLAEAQLSLGNIMEGWDGWDKPHLFDMITGGIVPTSRRALVRDAWDWRCGRRGRWNLEERRRLARRR